MFLYRNFGNHPLYGSSVLVGVLILQDGTGCWHTPFPNGNGTIATVNFRVMYQERGLEKPPLPCDLNLTETLVFNDDCVTIPHNVQGGIYKIFPTNIADINYDGGVDTEDFLTVALAFGETPGRPRWNPIADVNSDQKINLTDVLTVALNFGWVQNLDP